MAYSKEFAEFVVRRSKELSGRTWSEKMETINRETRERFGKAMNTKDQDSFRKSVSNLIRKVGDQISEGESELQKKLDSISSGTESKKKYEVKDGNYHIPTKNGTFVIPCTEADKLFFDYSEKGLDLSQEEIIQNYRLKPEAWNAIKSAFRLYKKSHVVSPYTLETADPEVLDHIIEDANAVHIDRFREKFKSDYDRQYELNVKKWKSFYYTERLRMEEWERVMANWKPMSVTLPELPEKRETGPDSGKLFVFMSDLHIGNKSTAGTLAAISMITQRCVSASETEIYIVDGGDNGEAFTEMHEGQIQGNTDQDWGYGWDLVMNIADLLEKMVVEILKSGKQVYFYGMQGNHDRFGKKQENDPKFTAGSAIYELLKRGLRNTSAKVAYAKERVEAIEYETFVMVLHHGLVKGPPEKFAMPYMHFGKHVFVVSGHEHSMNVAHGFNVTHVKLPGLAGPGDFDRNHLMFGQRGAVFARPNGHGTVDFDTAFFETDNEMPVMKWEDID